MAWLFAQIWIWCLAAFLLGLLIGWLLWGRVRSPRSEDVATPVRTGGAETEVLRPDDAVPVGSESEGSGEAVRTSVTMRRGPVPVRGAPADAGASKGSEAGRPVGPGVGSVPPSGGPSPSGPEVSGRGSGAPGTAVEPVAGAEGPSGTERPGAPLGAEFGGTTAREVADIGGGRHSTSEQVRARPVGPGADRDDTAETSAREAKGSSGFFGSLFKRTGSTSFNGSVADTGAETFTPRAVDTATNEGDVDSGASVGSAPSASASAGEREVDRREAPAGGASVFSDRAADETVGGGSNRDESVPEISSKGATAYGDSYGAPLSTWETPAMASVDRGVLRGFGSHTASTPDPARHPGSHGSSSGQPSRRVTVEPVVRRGARVWTPADLVIGGPAPVNEQDEPSDRTPTVRTGKLDIRTPDTETTAEIPAVRRSDLVVDGTTEVRQPQAGASSIRTPGISTGGDAGVAEVTAVDTTGVTPSGAIGGAGPRVADRDDPSAGRVRVVTAAERPYGPGSATALADGSAPSERFTVKGTTRTRIYHTTDSPYFAGIKAEVWFRTAVDADRAGFQPWNRREPRTDVTGYHQAFRHGPYPGSALARADGVAPTEEFTVKGNSESMLFHTLESPYFTRTVAEVWFRHAEDAEDAGFTAWNKRRARPVAPPLSGGVPVQAGPYRGSALPASDGGPPAEEYTVKGNMQSMLYHTQHSPFFGVTRAEVWFRTEHDAQAAGLRPWIR